MNRIVATISTAGGLHGWRGAAIFPLSADDACVVLRGNPNPHAEPVMKPVSGKAEVGIDFPEKAYMGSFGQGAGLDCHVDASGVTIRLVRTGSEKREIDLHLRHELFAEIIDEAAQSFAETRPKLDDDRRETLVAAARALVKALS